MWPARSTRVTAVRRFAGRARAETEWLRVEFGAVEEWPILTDPRGGGRVFRAGRGAVYECAGDNRPCRTLIITMSDFEHHVCSVTLIMRRPQEGHPYTEMIYAVKHLPKIHVAY